jgi:prefoldin subunit 5
VTETDWKAVAERYKARIEVLEKARQQLQEEVESLGVEIDRLEAEDLQPLVDRLREQIGRMQKLVASMAAEIADLNGS